MEEVDIERQFAFERWLLCYEKMSDWSKCKDVDGKHLRCYETGIDCEHSTWFECYWDKKGCYDSETEIETETEDVPEGNGS